MYWAEGRPGGDGAIVRLPVAGGVPEDFAPSITVNQIVIDATDVYWSDSPELDHGNIVKAPRAGGASQPLTRDQGGPGGIAVDAESIFWTNYVGSVMKMPLAGGGPTELASEPSGSTGLGSIAIDESWVYWSHGGDGGRPARR